MGLAEKLPKTFSASNREKTKRLKRRIQDDVKTPQMAGPYYLRTTTVFNFLLPPITNMPEEFGKLLCDGIVDSCMKKELDECKVLNWCRNIRTLSPIKNKGDGNCLLHAVSLFMWGVHDSMLLLRRLLYIALVQDTGQTQARWRKERGFLDQNIPEGCQLNSEQWESEWQHVVKSAEDQRQERDSPNRLPYESLEEVHIFMLSNILRRPIIVLGDTVIRSIRGQTLATNNFVGIYLPLLVKSSECIKSPIVLGFASNHFVPLVMEEDLASDEAPITSVEAVALVTHTLTFIGVHFLMEEEEERVSSILQEYLHITEVPVTQKTGLTQVLSAKLQITKLPDEYNLMIDFVQAAERVFAGEEAILPANQQTNTDDTDPVEKRKEFNERYESPTTHRYLASRERQQRMLNHQAHPSLKANTVNNTGDEVNFNFDDKSKAHHSQSKVPLPTKLGKREQHAKVPPTVRNIQSVKCKTPKCKFYGSDETYGYCSACLQEHLKRDTAARRAAAASRMDSYEMSVTSTDCQFSRCPYVASAYTYPYCHEHKTFSPYYVPGAPAGAGAGGTRQQVNDLNKDRNTKSSSLTEQSSASGKRSMERQQSRSLEDIPSPTEGPRYVHEPKLERCNVPGCTLMGRPENQLLCTQHYTELKLRQKQRMAGQGSNTDHRDYVQKKMQRVEEWLESGKSFHNARAYRSTNDPEVNMTSDSMLTPGSQPHKCRNERCRAPGNKLFLGFCTGCYLKLDINGDTDVIEPPPVHHLTEENRDDVDMAQINEEEDRNSNRTSSEIRDNINNVNIEGGGDLESISMQGPPSEMKQEGGSRADSQDYHKCKNDTCNRLARLSGTDGFCSDCKAQDSRIVEPPSPQSYFEPGLRVDTAAAAAAAPLSNQTEHFVRNVSLQSCPSLPVKQSYVSKKSTTPVGPPTQKEVSTQLKCATSGCSGIYVNLDKSNTGLCFKCLKARKQTGRPLPAESGNKEMQDTANMSEESPTSNGDAVQLLRRCSGGRRSGRKRHTITVPPSVPYGGLDMEASSEKSCMSPLCNKTGSTVYGGFCKDCFEWMCLKFEQFDMQGAERDEMTPCSTTGCEFFGTQATKGYCSQCFRKQQTTTGKEVTFGMERRYSSGRSITPPPGTRGQLCANQYCDQYGQKEFYNFCPSCFKLFDSCTGISYSPPPTRGSFVPSAHSLLDSEPYWVPPTNSVAPPPLPPRAGPSMTPPYIPPTQIGSSDTSAVPYYTSHTSGQPSARLNDVASRFGETMERVETATRVGKAKCLTPHCTSFGNSKCQGYCNGCFVKLHRASFV